MAFGCRLQSRAVLHSLFPQFPLNNANLFAWLFQILLHLRQGQTDHIGIAGLPLASVAIPQEAISRSNLSLSSLPSQPVRCRAPDWILDSRYRFCFSLFVATIATPLPITIMACEHRSRPILIANKKSKGNYNENSHWVLINLRLSDMT
jgi:hypothetical protein